MTERLAGRDELREAVSRLCRTVLDSDRTTLDLASARQIADQYLRLLDDHEIAMRALDRAQLDSIEARNPGIDMDEVKRLRAERKA